MLGSLVGSDMCIRDRTYIISFGNTLNHLTDLNSGQPEWNLPWCHHYQNVCLLYTSDAADELLCVDLGCRRLLNKKQLVMPTEN